MPGNYRMSTLKCFPLLVSAPQQRLYFQKAVYHTNDRTDYAQNKHTTDIVDLNDCKEGQCRQKVTFKSGNLSLELNATIDCGNQEESTCPEIVFEQSKLSSNLGDGVTATFRLHEGQAVSFVLCDADDHSLKMIDTALINELQIHTQKYWSRWIDQSKYTGRWEQVVTRSLLLLKMLTFEPSGAIVAAPTFSLPEDIGGSHALQSLCKNLLIATRGKAMGL
jgi:GH15 family glucan-1,4-alpha-glucosidase